MPERHIRIRGQQREDVDVDLLVQALLIIDEERIRKQEQEAVSARSDASSGVAREAAA